MGKMKQTSFGCLGVTGVLMGLAGLVVLLLCIGMMVSSEKELDKKRAEYSEYSKELDEYYADSLKQKRYNEILDQMDRANERGDSALTVALQDSLRLYAPPEQRGVIGVNIGAAFLMIPAAAGLVMMALGLVIAVVFFCLWKRERKKHRIDNV